MLKNLRKLTYIFLYSLVFLSSSALAARLAGAIFTTDPGGNVVNANVQYTDKREVYLDGGPGPNAPSTAAGLEDGLYVFQVTDPAGKALLSQDPSKCRIVRVENGLIVGLVLPSTLGLGLTDAYDVVSGNGKNATIISVACHIQDEPDKVAGPSGQHDTNTDTDHYPPAIVVQLMPFLDTPNPGGVYKAWMMPLDRYLQNNTSSDFDALNTTPSEMVKVKGKDVGFVPDPGFGPSRDQIKTDNFKVERKGGKTIVPPILQVMKFHDANFNGIKDDNEPFVTGWPIDITDPLGLLLGGFFTNVEIIADPAGTYTVEEKGLIPDKVLQTVSTLDGNIISSFADGVLANPMVNVDVQGTDGESHLVIYGDVGLGDIKVCKSYGDKYMTGISGWKMMLTGTGAVLNGLPSLPVTLTQLTGQDGCTDFVGLLPGLYTVSEVMADTGDPDTHWENLTPLTVDNISIESILDTDTATISGTHQQADFKNICVKDGVADFGTKGYWHNKNGLTEMTDADIAYVNGLVPYSSASSYFMSGDEPFDGMFSDGTPVAAAKGSTGDEIAPAGSPRAEISAFLVESVDEAREQLAQQLLAFIFNTRHRIDGADALLTLPSGDEVLASDLISQAISLWESGSDADRDAIKTILDNFNNGDAIPYKAIFEPGVCQVIYPN